MECNIENILEMKHQSTEEPGKKDPGVGSAASDD
jgi:hypothetical protein